MTNIIVCLSLLGYIFSARRYLKIPIEASPFFIVSSLIVVLYFFAYVNFLQMAGFVLLIAGLLGLIVILYELKSQRDCLFNDYLTPGIILYLLFGTLYGILAKTIGMTNFTDDVMRWLPHARILLDHHGLWTYLNFSPSPDYPPGGSLFYYFFLQLTGFSLGNVFFAQTFLLLSPLVLLSIRVQYKNFLPLLFLSSLLLFLYSHFMRMPIGARVSTMMDYPVALFFGGILASYFLMKEMRHLALYLLAPMLALMIFKPMVFPYAMMITCIVLLDQYLDKNFSFKKMLMYSGLLLLSAVTVYSWQHHLIQENLGSIWDFSQVMSAFVTKKIPLTTQQYQQTLSTFHHLSDVSIKFSLLMVLLVGAVSYFVPNRQERVCLYYTHAILLVSFIAYLFLLLQFYIYQMDMTTATTLGSFTRFRLTFEIGWIFVLIAQAKQFVVLPNFSYKNVKIVLSLLSITIFSLLTNDVFRQMSANHRMIAEKHGYHYLNKTLQPIILSMKEHIEPDAKVLVVGTQSAFYLYLFTSFKLLPNPSTFCGFDQTQGKVLLSLIPTYDYVIFIGAEPLYWQQKLANYTVDHGHPFATIIYRADTKEKHPSLQQFPLYLYQIKIANKDIHLQNISPAPFV